MATAPTERLRRSTGFVAWQPPVVEPPAALIRHDYVAAHAYTGADLTTGAPVLEGLVTVQAPRHRTRIVVAGRDVTFFRGVRTPDPAYSLMSPLLYGSGSIEFPQVHAAFEQPGSGDLAWLRPFAPIRVQRVDEAGVVVATDYVGYLLDPQVRGRVLTFGLMGEATGPAQLDYRPPRIFRRRNDIGHWWSRVLLAARVRRGTQVSTGISLQNQGDMSYLDYAQELSAAGVNRNGNQWTAMPDANGIYQVKRKNTTTIAGTVYFDDARTVADLRRDPAEEPNTIYATGVSPNGRRIRFADYPALQLQPEDVPPFPNTDPSNRIVEGDTDADTDSGGGVTALVSRLWQTGYLDFADRAGGFDADVTRAVRDLQADAGLATNGQVGPATWEAMFDFGVTGYSISGAQIRPAAQLTELQRLLRTPSGAVLGPNPAFDPNRLIVARAIDVGAGFTQQQVRNFARSEIHEGTTPNWTGTITFGTGALIRGAVAPGSSLDEADVMDARELRPGMNLWAPLFDGGTVLHVSGVEVSRGDGGRLEVTASVDTRARDTMEVWEVIARNRESRRSPARQWMREFRSSIMNKDSVLEWDNLGGTTPAIELEGGKWNVFPVVAGQEGTIARLRMKVNPEREFVVAVFGRKIGPGVLGGRIGNPLTKAGSEKWTDTAVIDSLKLDRLLLYVAGDDTQPCGYYPGRKDSEGPSLLTGRWEDDASFGYRCYDDYSLWVAIYPDGNCTLRGGRIMWNQAEAGS